MFLLNLSPIDHQKGLMEYELTLDLLQVSLQNVVLLDDTFYTTEWCKKMRCICGEKIKKSRTLL